MEFGILVRLVGVMKLVLIACRTFIIQMRTYLCGYAKKNKQTNKQNFYVGLYSDVYRPISFKLGLIIETTKLYILVSALMSLTSTQVTVVLEMKDFGINFLANSSIDLNEIQYGATACLFVKAHASCTFNIVMCRDNC